MENNENSRISVEVADILSRFQQGFPAYIDCDNGWLDLVVRCHLELLAIDPEYTIAQIKEKFGALRYYFSTTNPDVHTKMATVISKYEKESLLTCEKCGSPGHLTTGSVLKTLCAAHVV